MLDAIDMTALGINQLMVVVDSFVVESLHEQSVITTPAIRKHNTGWSNFPANDWHQLGSSTIGNHLCINTSATLQNVENSNFSSSTPDTDAFALTSKVLLIDFNKPSNASDIFCSWYSAINLRILVKNNAAVFRCMPTISPAARAVDPDTNSFNSSPV